jgi:hypothetical protein
MRYTPWFSRYSIHEEKKPYKKKHIGDDHQQKEEKSKQPEPEEQQYEGMPQHQHCPLSKRSGDTNNPSTMTSSRKTPYIQDANSRQGG